VAAGVAVLLVLMFAVASFLLWRTEVRRASTVVQMLEPRFRIEPVVAASKDRVRAVVEVVNESQVRNHNLRVAVVAVDRTSGEPADDGAAGFTGPLPLEDALRAGEPAERYSATLDGRARFDLAIAKVFQKGVLQCARNSGDDVSPWLPEGQAYVFYVEAAADDGPRIEARLELRTTMGGPPTTDTISGRGITRRRLPSFSFQTLSDEPGTADN